MVSQDHRIHSFKECVLEGSDYFQQTLGRRRSLTHKKRRRKMGAIEDQALTIQDPSSDEEYEELNSYSYYHLDKK